jgi:hypothetical protein
VVGWFDSAPAGWERVGFLTGDKHDSSGSRRRRSPCCRTGLLPCHDGQPSCRKRQHLLTTCAAAAIGVHYAVWRTATASLAGSHGVTACAAATAAAAALRESPCPVDVPRSPPLAPHLEFVQCCCRHCPEKVLVVLIVVHCRIALRHISQALCIHLVQALPQELSERCKQLVAVGRGAVAGCCCVG